MRLLDKKYSSLLKFPLATYPGLVVDTSYSSHKEKKKVIENVI